MDLAPTAPAGISTERFAANLSALTCPRAHAAAVPVDDLTGELVAWLCPDCDKQLPADWRRPRPSITDTFFNPDLIEHPKRRKKP